MQSVRKKIALKVVVSNLSTVVNFGLAIIMARLLSPDDIGVFSMSAVLIAIAHTFRDFGVTSYLKREKELTDQTIRTARGLLYLTSWSMALAMFVSAGFWASFFNEPRVEEVVHVLALGFVFIPFGAIPQAIMGRELNVVQSSKVVILSTLVYFIACVTLANLGFQHMTMAWANLINILITGLAYNVFLGRRLPWRPSLQLWRGMVSFGTANILTSLCNVVNTSIPDLLLGRMSVAADVGLFSRATSTVNMVGKVIDPSISYFTLPYMARIYHSTGSVNADYVRATSIINCVLLPVLAWVALMANDIVFLLFGEKWLGAVPAIPWLCAATGVATLFSLATSTVTGVGKPYAALAPLIALIAGKVTAAIFIYDGTLRSFAISIFLGELASSPFYIYLMSKHLKINLAQWGADTTKTVTIATLSLLLTSFIYEASITQLHSLAGLPITFFLIILFSIIAYFIIKLPISDELRRAEFAIRHMIKKAD